MSYFLAVENLSFYASNGDALLQDVSFQLAEGDILAIAGPNGAGKTTLLNLMCGIVPLSSGDVRISGRSIRSFSSKYRACHIAVVSQQEMPDARLQVRDYIALGQIPILSDHSGEDHAADLEHILDITQLSALSHQRIATLSGGERQRAHIARALAQKPSLLFLDEPTNHLDPEAKGRILSLVTELGITVVMVVHDLVMIPEFATHVALMKESLLTTFGPVHEVLTAQNVRTTFGVDYLCFPHKGRNIPALDIRKIKISTKQEHI